MMPLLYKAATTTETTEVLCGIEHHQTKTVQCCLSVGNHLQHFSLASSLHQGQLYGGTSLVLAGLSIQLG